MRVPELMRSDKKKYAFLRDYFNQEIHCRIVGRVDSDYVIEIPPLRKDTAGMQDEEIPPPIVCVVARKYLNTIMPLLTEDFIKDGHYRAKGAGGAGVTVNGDFGRYPVRTYRNHPVYRNENKAIIYWGGFWKINYYDDTGGWYYAFENSHVFPEPPEGQWSNYGYSGGRAQPCPFISKGGVPFPKPTGRMKRGELCILNTPESLVGELQGLKLPKAEN